MIDVRVTICLEEEVKLLLKGMTSVKSTEAQMGAYEISETIKEIEDKQNDIKAKQNIATEPVEVIPVIEKAKVTLDQLRALCSVKRNAEKDVASVLNKYAAKLSEVKEEDYEAMYAEVNAL